MAKHSSETIEDKLKKSPINYFSDLFICTMVVAWIVVLCIMTIMGIYSTIFLSDTTIWCYIQELTAVPLTAGGVVWMLKNGSQHIIAYSKGKLAHMDFPSDDLSIESLDECFPEVIEEATFDNDPPE